MAFQLLSETLPIVNEFAQGDFDCGFNIIKQLADRVNGGNVGRVAEGMISAMRVEHRTLQQSTIRTLVEFLRTYGKQFDDEEQRRMRYDGRNEMAGEFCSNLNKVINGDNPLNCYLPLI